MPLINSFLKFKSFQIKDIASPLLIAIAAQLTASDEIAEVKIIAEKNNKIVEIHPFPLSITIQDGFYLGFINEKYGTGLVIWKFQFDAAHYEPHKYEIKIFSYDNKETSFIPKDSFITEKKFNTGYDALKAYNLPCENYRDKIIKNEEDISTLGAESLLPHSKSVKKTHN